MEHIDAAGNVYKVTGHSVIKYGRNAGKRFYRLVADNGARYLAVIGGALKRTTELYRARKAGEPKRPRRRSWWLQMVLDAYYEAREVWLAAREVYANGYEAEEAMFAEFNPRPLYKNFLIAARIH